MASESSDRRAVSISLPPELQEWVEGETARLDVDTEDVVEQLLASYRATEQLDGDGEDLAIVDSVQPDDAVVEEMVRETVRQRLDDIANAVEERLDGDVSQEEFEAELDRIESRLGDRVSRTEADFQDKLEDVRERVVQVKRETDGKAPLEHDHEDVEDRLDGVESSLHVLRTELNDAIDGLQDEVSDRSERLDAIEDRLDDVEQKLRTVAWVVSDLRDAHDSESGTEETLDRLKRTAAEEGFDRARCDNCGNEVQLSLLTEPNCPHCDATVSAVEGSSGFFGRPRLVVAKQLESGEETGSVRTRGG